MVECEFRSVQPNVRRIRVLIDTWWNVNSGVQIIDVDSGLVLIDTWWNVNLNEIKKLNKMCKF